MTEETLLGALQQATAPQHQALEQHSFAQALLAGTATRRQIMSHTRAEWCLYATIEPWLLDCTQTQDATWRQLISICKQRAPTLRKDDEAYHQQKAESLLQAPQEHAIALAAQLKQRFDQDRAAGIGILYVTEGSHLGGQIIAHHLKQNFPQDQAALSRYELYPHMARHWRSFCELLNALSLSSTQRKSALSSAVACFEGFDAIIRTLGTT